MIFKLIKDSIFKRNNTTNKKQSALDTKLYKAVMDNKLTKVKDCITDGANVNTKDSLCDMPIIMNASMMGHADIVKELLNSGANIDTVDQWGYNSLLVAVQNKCCFVAELLIASGANVNHTNKQGETALMKCCCTDKIKTVESLIKAGADINAVNKSGQTAFDYAMQTFNTGAMKLLVEAGMDISIRNSLGQSPTDVLRTLVYKNSRVYQLANELDDIFINKKNMSQTESVIEI